MSFLMVLLAINLALRKVSGFDFRKKAIYTLIKRWCCDLIWALYNQIVLRPVSNLRHLFILVNAVILILLLFINLLLSLSLIRLLLLILKRLVISLWCHFQKLIVWLLVHIIGGLEWIDLTGLQHILIILKLLLVVLLAWYTLIPLISLIVFSCFAWAYLPIISWVVFYLSLPVVRKYLIVLLVLLNVNTLLKLIILWVGLCKWNLLIIHFLNLIFLLLYLALPKLIPSLHTYTLFHRHQILLWYFLRLKIISWVVLILCKIC